MIRGIEKCVDLRDCHFLLRLSHFHDLVPRTHFAFLQDAEVESWSSTGCQQCRHARFIHSNADAVAGNARLSDLEDRTADLITIADAHGIIWQSFDCEVLAELAVNKVGSPQLLLPIAVRFHLVDEDGPLLTPMSGQVALPVSFQI